MALPTEEFQTSESGEPVLLAHVLISLIGIAAVLGSAFTLLVLNDIKLTTDSQSFLLKLLAIFDFIIGFLLVVSVFQQNVTFLRSPLLCKIILVCICLCNIGTTYLLTVIALDKLFTILRPLHYQQIFTSFRVLSVMSVFMVVQGIWMIYVTSDDSFLDLILYTPEFGVCIPSPFNRRRFSNAFLLVWTVITIFITFGSYLWIGIIARKQNKQVSSLTSPEGNNLQLRLKEWKGIRIAVGLTVVFMVTWFPMNVIGFLGTNLDIDIDIRSVLIATILMFTNAWMNIFIYFLLYRAFRQKGKLLVEGTYRKVSTLLKCGK